MFLHSCYLDYLPVSAVTQVEVGYAQCKPNQSRSSMYTLLL